MKSVKLGCLALFALVQVSIVAPRTVGDDWLIAGFDNSLWNYTQGSGAAVNPRPITVAGGLVTGIDFNAAGTLFGLTTKDDNSLYEINPTTGAATIVGPTGLTGVIEGDIGFDPTTGVLYGLWNEGGSGNQLFTINTTSGAATAIGPIAGDDPSGLAFDNSGQMWVINSNVNSTQIPTLLEVDKTNGNTLTTQSTGLDLGSGHSLLGADFNPVTNQLYFAMDNGNFYRENTTTGVPTLVDTHGVTNASGLAFVPEPGSVVSLLLGAPALAWLCRKRLRAK